MSNDNSTTSMAAVCKLLRIRSEIEQAIRVEVVYINIHLNNDLKIAFADTISSTTGIR